MITKQCTKCHKVKPIDEFWKLAAGRDGYNPRCKECAKKDNNTESIRAAHKLWYEKQKAKARAQKEQKEAEWFDVEGHESKTCTRCKRTLRMEGFGKNPKYCKFCKRADDRKYLATPGVAEMRRQKTQEWRDKQRGKR